MTVMQGWQFTKRKAMAVGFMLLLLMVATKVEAGVFGWFKKTEIQWSPEIRGVITENGIPVTGLEVVRDLFYEDKEFRDSTVTDRNGYFTLPRKTLKTRRVLFDYSVGLLLSVPDHPTSGEVNQFFDIRWGNQLDGKALNLLMSDMQCELTAEEKSFSLKNLDVPDGAAPWFGAKCTFTHASTSLYSDQEIEEQMRELDRIIDQEEGI